MAAINRNLEYIIPRELDSKTQIKASLTLSDFLFMAAVLMSSFLVKDLVTFLGGDPFPKCRLFLRCQFFAPLSNDQVCDLPGDWCVHKLFSLFYYMTPPGVKMGI